MFRVAIIWIFAVVATGDLFAVENETGHAISQGSNTCVTSESRICAGYMGVDNIDVLQNMAKASMNTALVKVAIHDPITNEEVSRLKIWAENCKKNGLDFMPVINVWGTLERDTIKPKHKLFYDGDEHPNTPCPLDLAFYEKSINNRCLTIAKLSRKIPIAGVVFDLEMYGGNHITFPPICLCDRCFGRFLKSHNLQLAVDIEQRQKYLVSTNQMKTYSELATEVVAYMAGETSKQVAMIAPELMLGFSAMKPDKHITYHHGLAKGFSSTSRPINVFSKSHYFSGYDQKITEEIKKFKNSGLNVRYVVGLWQQQFPVDKLPEQYYHCARISEGYYIYSLGELSKKSRGDHALDNEYWNAIAVANREIVQYDKNKNYKSLLKLTQYNFVEKEIGFEPVELPLVKQARPKAKNSSQVMNAYLRHKAKLIFHAKKGDVIDFEAAFVKKGNNLKTGAKLALFDYKGRIIDSATAEMVSNAKLTSIARYTGPYAVTINVERNMVKILKSSHPYSIDAATRINLTKPTDKFYLWKPVGLATSEITFLVDGGRESVVVKFQHESGELIGEYDITAKHHLKLPPWKKQDCEVIEMLFSPRSGARLDDVLITVEAGLGPYISPFKSGLTYPLLK